jgi:hypothetical protein
MDIHKNIKNKLHYFIKTKKIPHIVFHGPSGAGKRGLLEYFITNIYKSVDNSNKYVMYINCAHGKGIRFIRDELKFFAKTNIQHKNGNIFKSVILFNADKLTTDAQSALRRCIEQFSHTTRFFIIIDQHDKLLKPIISRFCNIHVPLPVIEKLPISLHEFKKKQFNGTFKDIIIPRNKWLQKSINQKKNYSTIINCQKFTEKIYEKGYSGLDVMETIEEITKIDDIKKYGLLMHFDKIRREFRNEKLFIFYILTVTFLRQKDDLENIKEM